MKKALIVLFAVAAMLGSMVSMSKAPGNTTISLATIEFGDVPGPIPTLPGPGVN